MLDFFVIPMLETYLHNKTQYAVSIVFISTLEGFEALQGNPGRASDKLQQPGSALLVEGLHSFPKPFNYVAVWSAMFEPRVGLPVIDVDFTQATYNQLQEEKRGVS